MKVSEHIRFYEQEMTRRNFAKNTVENYSGCVKVFLAVYTHISHNLISKIQSPINNIKL